jgi:hypothetical protein
MATYLLPQCMAVLSSITTFLQFPLARSHFASARDKLGHVPQVTDLSREELVYVYHSLLIAISFSAVLGEVAGLGGVLVLE